MGSRLCTIDKRGKWFIPVWSKLLPISQKEAGSEHRIKK